MEVEEKTLKLARMADTSSIFQARKTIKAKCGEEETSRNRAL